MPTPLSFRGPLYRALNPVYADDPLSGRGAELYGGRFNPRGMPALYTSLSIRTALGEAHQAGRFQPLTLVAYDAAIDRVFDGRAPEALAAEGFDAAMLGDTGWRDRMKRDGEAPTQGLARRLAASGHGGILVPSFAPGAGPGDLNLVLWRWGTDAPARLVLVDDEGRLD